MIRRVPTKEEFTLSYLLYIISAVVVIFLGAIQTAMFLRAILSWFPIENKFIDFLHVVTEPIIYPVRRLFERMNWFQNSPIDFSFMATWILLSLLMLFLS